MAPSNCDACFTTESGIDRQPIRRAAKGHEETFQQVHLIASRLHLASVFRRNWDIANIDLISSDRHPILRIFTND